MDPVAIGVLGRARQAQAGARLRRRRSAFPATWAGAMSPRNSTGSIGLDLGDANVAAQRLDAIMRQFPDTSRDALINDVTASVEGRTALAAFCARCAVAGRVPSDAG
jgi:hypothetical protein